jgi:hypothetical protein
MASLTGHGDAAPVSSKPLHCMSCRPPSGKPERPA